MIGARTFTNKTRAEDVACIIYGRLGFSLALIAKRTGLTKAAVSYRLKLLNVKLADYRNGESPLAERIIDAANAESLVLIEEIRKRIRLSHAAPRQLQERH